MKPTHAERRPINAAVQTFFVLSLIAAVPLGYLVLHGVAIAVAAPAAALPPSNYGPLLKLGMRAARDPRRKVSTENIDMAKRALAAIPLAYQPFFITGKAAEQTGDFARAAALFEEARRRRPNSPSVRLQLVALYARAGNYSGMMAELEVMLALSSDARPRLLPELVKASRAGEGRKMMAALLAKRPAWAEEFVNAAVDQKLAPEHASDLVRLTAAEGRRLPAALEGKLLVGSLVAAGRYGEARSEWLRLLPPNQRERHALIADGQFDGAKIPEPFHWVLHDLDVGRAEIVRAEGLSGLEMSYFGGRIAVLAEQKLALRPGRYTLSVSARSPDGAAMGDFSWRITCVPSGHEVGQARLARLKADYSTVKVGVVVPAAGCGGQTLNLVAEPGEAPRPTVIQIAAVGISR